MLQPSRTSSNRDPLAIALARKASAGASGATRADTVATGEGWRVVDIVCTSGPDDRPFEERQQSTTISLVLTGAFVYRSERGASLLSVGSLLLGNPGESFECSHEHGEGDRCLSFQFDSEVFDRLAWDAGASRAVFDRDRLPPLRGLAAATSRATLAAARGDDLEERSFELAGAVLRAVAEAPRERAASRDPARIAKVLRRLEARSSEAHPLAELARSVGLSPYHFLRTFKDVTGVTPHQWLLRARLRDAAERLVRGRRPITEIALDVGFDDLSNFIRSFRAEFGVSPRRYRVLH